MRILRGVVIFALALSLFSESDPGPLHFVDVAAKAGLTAPNVSGDETRKRFILEMNGSGVAFLDYNNDGLPDIFIVNGTRFEPRRGKPAPTSHLYRNNGDGTFTDVTEKAGVGYSGWGQGACAGDYDNDGFVDLFVTYYGLNRLYHNNGDGTFRDVAASSGVAGAMGRWNSGCAFVDYDRDGKLDLFVANYVDLGLDLTAVPPPGSGQFCQYKGVPIACGPRGLKTAPNYLFHNRGNGTFEDTSAASGVRKTEGHYALGVLTLDYDNDGWPDIFVACDSAASILLHNNQDGTFTDRSIPSGTAFNDDGEPQAGMGVAAADYDHDGLLDIVKTNFSDDSPNLYRNNGNGTFTDKVFEAGLGRLRNYLGWGVIFADFDNDGWADLLMVNGHLTSEIDAVQSDSKFRQRKLFYRNLQNGKFVDLGESGGPGLAGVHSSRGAAAADFRNDGRLAVLVNEIHEPPALLVLEGRSTNHWIGIRTIGTKSNRAGIGARVEVQAGKLKLIDEVRSGGSYLSQNDLRIHFGLGAAAQVDSLTVRWPSGRTDQWTGIPADRQIVVEEGAQAVRTKP